MTPQDLREIADKLERHGVKHVESCDIGGKEHPVLCYLHYSDFCEQFAGHVVKATKKNAFIDIRVTLDEITYTTARSVDADSCVETYQLPPLVAEGSSTCDSQS